MESPGLRQLLLETIAAAREREHEFLALCDDSPPEPGLWTVKDHLAHLTAWRIMVGVLLDSGRTGPEAPRMDEDVQASNARVYAANKDKTADVVKSNARAAYDRLEAAIAACSDEDLLKPHPRPRSAGVALWQTAPGHVHHLAEHLMFWHLEQGNEEAAEAAQLWVHGLGPGPVSRAQIGGRFYVRPRLLLRAHRTRGRSAASLQARVRAGSVAEEACTD